MHVAEPIALWADDDSIVDLRYTRRPPRGSLRLLAFGRRAHSAPQNDLTTDCFDRDSASVNLGRTPQCILDLAPDFRGRHVWLHLNGVSHPLEVKPRSEEHTS